MGWFVAQKLGLDKQQGLKLDLVVFAGGDNAKQIAALKNGSIDAYSASTASSYPYFKAVPTIRSFMIVDQFKGFIIVGRKGDVTYDGLINSGKSHAQAVRQVVQSMKGKSFCIHKAIFATPVEAALKNGGLTLADVKIVDFADDTTAASAFLGGQCDYYTGSLPQETKMMTTPGGKYVAVAGAPVIGPPGLWYGTALSTESWIKSHQSTVLKMYAVHLRATRYVYEKPSVGLTIVRDAINKAAASNFTTQQVKFNLDTFDRQITPQYSESVVFNPKHPLYYAPAVGYFVKQGIKEGIIPKGTPLLQFDQEGKYFNLLRKNPTLWNWVMKPL
jgi:ABC-type nitrate/sulfonate/bicarbonate transport system substrate-binding protein